MFSSEAEILFYLFLFGALFGSFANVVIYRMPLDRSVVTPRSYCGQCFSSIAWYDNIPIFSWFILRGRCRSCQTSYSFRYPFIEFLTGLLFAGSYYYLGFSWTFFEGLFFGYCLIICSFIDFDHMILPDEFTLGGLALALLFAWLNPERSFVDALGGALMGGGFLYAIAYLYFMWTGREGMGGGDIKLLGWIGAMLGWKAIPFVIMVSACAGSVVGVLVAIRSKGDLKTVIPFGPYLAAAAMMYMYGGQTLAQWYVDLFLPGLN